MSLGGDRARLGRREYARTRIVAAGAAMVQLGLLLEGQDTIVARRKEYARVPSRIWHEFGSDGPTERQEEALLVAMNTPDIAVIQGPPGTGKTRVITALQSWLADELDHQDGLGSSVLLTSFQHDAVDNAANKTSVLDLPAVRIGRRRGDSGLRSTADRWVDGLRIQLGADLEGAVDAKIARRADDLVRMAHVYALEPRDAEATADLLQDAAELARDLVSGATRDGLLARAAALRTRERRPVAEDEEGLLVAARALRSHPVAFADDGRETAMRLQIALRRSRRLDDDRKALLERATRAAAASADLCAELAELRDELVDELGPGMPLLSPSPRHDLQARMLLGAAAAEALERAAASRGAVDAIVAAYRDAIEHHSLAVEDTLSKYAAVLAATCQHSAGRAMAAVKDGDFDTVIVDEAARANPLDLMIPMARARRRIVLVGDHRQLPHVLEPDVEVELSRSVADATREAFEKSLFERLFTEFEARRRRARDHVEPSRVVTLDTQFRMHSRLGAYVSEAFYKQDNVVLAAGLDDAKLAHEIKRYGSRVAVWEDVPLVRKEDAEQGRTSKSRPTEARRVASLLAELMVERPTLSFGVIAFYRAQVDQIHEALLAHDIVVSHDGEYEIAKRYRDPVELVRINTVDAFQGMEFDVVLLSMTRSSREPAQITDRLLWRRYGHLRLPNRLCVAMSRQRRLLIAVGDRRMVISPAGRQAVPELVQFDELCRKESGDVLT